jgi:hypothetical protein
MASNNENIFYLSIQDNSVKKDNRIKKNNRTKKVGNLNLNNPDNKVTYVSLQIYQGYSENFRNGVKEISDKLSVLMLKDFKKLLENREQVIKIIKAYQSFEKLLLKNINEYLKIYKKDIKSIIEQSIFSSITGTTQYFNNRNNYNKYALSLEKDIVKKMIDDIFDETLKKLYDLNNTKSN